MMRGKLCCAPRGVRFCPGGKKCARTQKKGVGRGWGSGASGLLVVVTAGVVVAETGERAD